MLKKEATELAGRTGGDNMQPIAVIVRAAAAAKVQMAHDHMGRVHQLQARVLTRENNRRRIAKPFQVQPGAVCNPDGAGKGGPSLKIHRVPAREDMTIETINRTPRTSRA